MLRSMKYGLHAALLAGLVATPVVWNHVDKSVTLTVDGQSVSIHTTAHTVGEVLGDNGYRIDAHDLVAPSPATAVKDDSTIVLRQGRQLHLTIDGKRTDAWTTEPTVAQALDALGYTSSDFVSVSRSQRLPLSATQLSIRTPQLVTVVHDGERQAVTTTRATVGGLLEDLGITVGAQDRLSTPRTTAISPGSVILLERVVQRTKSRLVSVKYPVTTRKDNSLYVGTRKVLREGRAGAAKITYALVYVDGKLTSHTVIETNSLREPQAKIVKVGTKHDARPANTPNAGTPDPGSAKAIAKKLLSARGWGNDQYDCLVQMWNRESGWRVNAANPSGAYGIPQALPGSKMSSAGSDWQSSATTQITWGLGYIAARYNTPCGAWSFWQAHNYY